MQITTMADTSFNDQLATEGSRAHLQVLNQSSAPTAMVLRVGVSPEVLHRLSPICSFAENRL